MSHDIEPNRKHSVETPSAENLHDRFKPDRKRSKVEKFGRGRQVAVISGIAVALAGVGVFGGKFATEAKDAPDIDTKPTAEAPVVPGEPTEPTSEPTPVESEAPVESGPETLRIPADLPAVELARASVELVDDWAFAGATDDTIEQTQKEQMRLIQEEGIGFDQAFVEIAEQNAQYYSKAVLIEDWESNEEAVVYREYLVQENARNIRDALRHYVNNEPLPYWTYEIDEVEELEAPEGERTIRFITKVTPQNSEGTAGTLMNVRGFDTKTGSAMLLDEASNLL